MGSAIIRFFTLIVLSFVYFNAKAATLSYQVTGITGNLLTNVQSHLGKSPNSIAERSNFLFNVEDDVLTAMHAYSYFNAKLETTLDKSTTPWHLTITITPNQVTTLSHVDVKLFNDAKFDDEFNTVIGNIPLNVGSPLNQSQYESLKSDLFNVGLERGYFDGKTVKQAINVDQKNNLAAIQLHYNSGKRYRFGKITFSEIDLSPDILRSLTPIKTGDFYHAEQLLALQNQLLQSRYMSAINVQPDRKNASDNYMPINVTFTPAIRHGFDIGLGYATDTENRFSLGWRMPKVNRHGHSLETKLTYSKINPTGRFKYKIPLTHPYKDVLQLGLRLEDDEFGAVDSKLYEFNVSRVRQIEGWIRTVYVRYLDEQWQSNTDDISAKYWLPGFSWSRTTKTGQLNDPDSGFNQTYTLEAAHPSIGSEHQVIHATAKFKWLHRFNFKHRLVNRTTLGISQTKKEDRDNLAPSLRFFAGGDQSIRGFSYHSLGPTDTRKDLDGNEYQAVIGGSRILTTSIEYQYYLKEQWRIPAFVDVGQAFDREKLSPVYSIGTGVHYISPIGAIRLEAAYSISEDDPAWRIHFTMGAEL